jgi:hypothetical protein
MGCDIHIIAEVKEDGLWKQNTDEVFPNPYYRPTWREDDIQRFKERYQRGDITKEQLDECIEHTLNDKDNYLESDKEFKKIPDDNRNYDWFAVLADVRNGRGFAGMMTGRGFAVIAEPKGVPYDACPEWIENVKEWGVDMHSHSWLTLEDFDGFDWNQSTEKTGVLSLEQYEELREKNEHPTEWDVGISGQGIVIVSMNKADRYLDGKEEIPEGQRTYVQYEWSVNYAQWFDYKIKNTIEPLRKLKEKYEDARIVFGFDN